MIKHGVDATGLRPEILLAIQEAREVYRKYGHDLVITSLLDGKHSEGSLHYKGLAVDLRTRHVQVGTRDVIAAKLRTALGAQYDVVLHKTHLHLEFDPK